MADPTTETQYSNVKSLNVPVDWVPITATGVLDRPARCIRCNVGGTLTVKLAQSGGAEREMIFADGETRLGVFLEIVDLGDCTGIEAGV
jgi:hypothetical protein